MHTNQNADMTLRGGFGVFVWAIIVGMGVHVGWGLISLIIEMAARAVGRA